MQSIKTMTLGESVCSPSNLPVECIMRKFDTFTKSSLFSLIEDEQALRDQICLFA